MVSIDNNFMSQGGKNDDKETLLILLNNGKVNKIGEWTEKSGGVFKCVGDILLLIVFSSVYPCAQHQWPFLTDMHF